MKKAMTQEEKFKMMTEAPYADQRPLEGSDYT